MCRRATSTRITEVHPVEPRQLARRKPSGNQPRARIVAGDTRGGMAYRRAGTPIATAYLVGTAAKLLIGGRTMVADC